MDAWAHWRCIKLLKQACLTIFMIADRLFQYLWKWRGLSQSNKKQHSLSWDVIKLYSPDMMLHCKRIEDRLWVPVEVLRKIRNLCYTFVCVWLIRAPGNHFIWQFHTWMTHIYMHIVVHNLHADTQSTIMWQESIAIIQIWYPWKREGPDTPENACRHLHTYKHYRHKQWGQK